MASDPTQMDRIALPDKQALVDHIIKMFRSAGKIDTQDPPYTNSSPLDSGTATQVRCVKQLFEQDSEGLAREAYCFMPADLNAADLDRPSFKQLQKQWEREFGKSGKGDGSFPEVRKRNALEPFSRCILRCMCGPCRHGEAAELQCDTHDFGDDYTILTHQFEWEDQMWAVILGTRDDPEEYSIWGKMDDKTKQLSYHDKIQLGEVSSTKPPERSGGNAIRTGEDRDFAPGNELARKRKDVSTASVRSKRRRTVAKGAGVKEPACNGTEGGEKFGLCTTFSDDDDEEDFKLSEQTGFRRKTIASPMPDDSSIVTSGPERASQSQHATPYIEQPDARNLQKAFVDLRAYVNSQMGSDGLPVIFSNAGIERYMRALEVAATKNNSYLFGSMRDMIGEELAKAGLPALPDV